MADTPTAAFSIRLRVRLDNTPGTLGRLATAIGEVGGNISALEGFEAKGPVPRRGPRRQLLVARRTSSRSSTPSTALDGVEVLELAATAPSPCTTAARSRSLRPHAGRRPRRPVDGLHAGRGPGLQGDRGRARRWPTSSPSRRTRSPSSPTAPRCSASATSARCGAMPVMEGKALLFKEFAGVDGFPICLDTSSDADEIIETVVRIAPAFGGINLEDIAAPACFEVEERLKELLDIPVFHDDQHGTAVVTLAALENALKIVDKKMADLTRRHRRRRRRRRGHRQDPAGGRRRQRRSASTAKGAICGRPRRPQRRPSSGSPRTPTPSERRARCRGAARRRRVHRRAAAPDLITPRRPAHDGQRPDRVRHGQPRSRRSGPRRPTALAAVMATGRSDYPNQINNVLVLPGHLPGRARRRRHRRSPRT